MCGCIHRHYRKTHVCRVQGFLSSAESRALGKATICRVPNNMHSANNWHSAEYLFAEWRPVGTRQRHTLPSAGQLTLGKYRHVHHTHPQTTIMVGAAFVCRVPTRGHSANRSLPSAPTVDTRQTLSRAPHTPLPRTFPFFHGRYRYCLRVPAR